MRNYTPGILVIVSILAPASGGTISAPEPRPQAGVARPQADVLREQAGSIDPGALRMALEALDHARAEGTPVRSDVLAVIDYSRPSTEPRLWVFDLQNSRLLFNELVAHGKNSGENTAVRFSNQPGSLMSSFGVYVTADTYQGRHGYSLRLRGLEKGVNDNSMERAIIIHAASYVDADLARRTGRIGRSWGCPAVRPAISRELIDTVKDGVLLFAYYPDHEWLRTSRFVGSGAVTAD